MAIPSLDEQNSCLSNLGMCGREGHIWSHPTNTNSLIYYLSSLFLYAKKSKALIVYLQRYWWSKNAAIILFQSTIWSGTWVMCITLLKRYFFIIKKLIKLLFWNLAVPPRLPKATPYKFRQVWVWLDFSQHTHQKAVVLNLTFPWWISPCKKPKKLMHYFHV